MSDGPAVAVPPRAGAPDDWVPVEHRLAGLDRRTIAPALAVLVFLLFLTFGVPLISGAIAADDPVQPGDVLRVGSGVTFVPTVGWNIESGLRSTAETGNAAPAPALVTNGTVAMSVYVDEFAGTPAELLDQIDTTTVGIQDLDGFQLVTDERSISTTSGIQGVASGFTGVDTEGVLAAFVVDGHGIEVIAYGSSADLLEGQDDIESMIGSITYTPIPKVAS